ncbi:hypothetical protein PDIG_01050 [Penicillium digitatum PHI26]|uniref:Uncharacterized protein n=2 Tax=Penicillium digitatum TaxID=36651 RepID=K9GFF7_PEND2|nr:hypothetical protein PDIP_12370 [Penicillium digitatum Pd1]EKV19764.1 hypothetical protein PDIG_01050 [Penicillium digitatum PHI26]EKV20865.1 hypothetical protein PDIP_12370 [Penicillium digitatum Pd1]
MPITFTPTPKHLPRGLKLQRVADIEERFKQSCPKEHSASKRLIGNSLKTSSTHTSPRPKMALLGPQYHLFVLQPEDARFTILSQLSFFVIAHSEDIWHLFVAHKSTVSLEITTIDTMDTVNFGEMALCRTELMGKRVVNLDSPSWTMPAFSTTTVSDEVVAAVIMMGSMQKYFSYQFALRCGNPSVTLLGERGDWELVVTKLAQLAHLGG